MSLETYAAIMADRIPTPAEFIGFVEGMGWQFRQLPDGRPAVRGPKDDPLAVATARMLSREPYRTNVLAILMQRWRADEVDIPINPPAQEPDRESQDRAGQLLREEQERRQSGDPDWRTPPPERSYPVVQADPAQREWLWPSGYWHRPALFSTGDQARMAHQPDWHPFGSGWWRWKGEGNDAWKPVPHSKHTAPGEELPGFIRPFPMIVGLLAKEAT